MSNKLKLLILTDHTSHTIVDSFYALLNVLIKTNSFSKIEISSRGIIENRNFFLNPLLSDIYTQIIANPIDINHNWQRDLIKKEKFDFDVVLFRIDQPIKNTFLNDVEKKNPKTLFINNPLGMLKTSSKDFLLNISKFTPNSKLVDSLSEILDISSNKEIVIKPLYSYGGKGISRIYKNRIFIENKVVSSREFSSHISTLIQKDKYVLVMDYLKNVLKGDKRIIVINGHILGAVLRVPNEDSWICNVTSGAKVIKSNVDEDELEIIKNINPILEEEGIIIYGIDTLVDNNGKRVLSEINTANIGGFIQLEKLTNEPILENTVKYILEYINSKKI